MRPRPGIDSWKWAFTLFERNFEADAADDVVGELPVVVEAALILELLDLLVGGACSGEMLDSRGDGFAVALGDIHQDAVHIEDEDR